MVVVLVGGEMVVVLVWGRDGGSVSVGERWW